MISENEAIVGSMIKELRRFVPDDCAICVTMDYWSDVNDEKIGLRINHHITVFVKNEDELHCNVSDACEGFNGDSMQEALGKALLFCREKWCPFLDMPAIRNRVEAEIYAARVVAATA